MLARALHLEASALLSRGPAHVATIFIPTRLRRLTGGADRVEMRGARCIGDLIDAVDARHPGFRAAVVQDDEIEPGLAVALNGAVLAGGLAEPIGDDESAEIHLIPALSGG